MGLRRRAAGRPRGAAARHLAVLRRRHGPRRRHLHHRHRALRLPRIHPEGAGARRAGARGGVRAVRAQSRVHVSAGLRVYFWVNILCFAKLAFAGVWSLFWAWNEGWWVKDLRRRYRSCSDGLHETTRPSKRYGSTPSWPASAARSTPPMPPPSALSASRFHPWPARSHVIRLAARAWTTCVGHSLEQVLTPPPVPSRLHKQQVESAPPAAPAAARPSFAVAPPSAFPVPRSFAEAGG